MGAFGVCAKCGGRAREFWCKSCEKEVAWVKAEVLSGLVARAMKERGKMNLARDYSERHGVAEKTALNRLEGVASRRVQRVSYEEADRISVLLGRHPAQLGIPT